MNSASSKPLFSKQTRSFEFKRPHSKTLSDARSLPSATFRLPITNPKANSGVTASTIAPAKARVPSSGQTKLFGNFNIPQRISVKPTLKKEDTLSVNQQNKNTKSDTKLLADNNQTTSALHKTTTEIQQKETEHSLQKLVNLDINEKQTKEDKVEEKQSDLSNSGQTASGIAKNKDESSSINESNNWASKAISSIKITEKSSSVSENETEKETATTSTVSDKKEADKKLEQLPSR